MFEMSSFSQSLTFLWFYHLPHIKFKEVALLAHWMFWTLKIPNNNRLVQELEHSIHIVNIGYWGSREMDLYSRMFAKTFMTSVNTQKKAQWGRADIVLAVLIYWWHLSPSPMLTILNYIALSREDWALLMLSTVSLEWHVNMDISG